MTYRTNETPGITTGGFEKPGYPTQTHPKITAKSAKTEPTQLDRVVAALRDRWVCAVAFNNGSFDRGKPILRYGSRIYEARQRGWWIERRPCQDIWHNHEALMYEWRVPPADTEQLDMFGGGL